MADIVRSIEGNYGQVTIAESPENSQSTVGLRLKKNIRKAVNQLTTKETSKLPTLTASEDSISKLDGQDFRLFSKAEIPTGESTTPAISSNQEKSPKTSITPKSKETGNKITPRRLNFKNENSASNLQKTPQKQQEVSKEKSSNRSMKSLDFANDKGQPRQASAMSEKEKKASKMNVEQAKGSVKHQLETIVENNTLKGGEDTDTWKLRQEAAKVKGRQRGTSRLNQVKPVGEEVKSKGGKNDISIEMASIPKKVINLTAHQKRKTTGIGQSIDSILKLQDFDNNKKQEVKSSVIQTISIEKSQKLSGSTAELHQITRGHLTADNRIDSKKLHVKQPVELKVTRPYPTPRSSTRPISAVVRTNADKKDGVEANRNIVKNTTKNNLPQSRSISSKPVQNQGKDSVDEPDPKKIIFQSTDGFVKQVNEFQIKKRKDLRYEPETHKRVSSKSQISTKGVNISKHIGIKPHEELFSRVISSKFNAVSNELSQVSHQPSFKLHREKLASPKPKGFIKNQMTRKPTASRSISSQPNYTSLAYPRAKALLNLLYGIVAKDLSNIEASHPRTRIKYRVCEGNNGRLIENFMREKMYTDFEPQHAKCNIQWSQTFHEKIASSNSKHLPRMMYKDLQELAEFSELQMDSPQSLSDSLADLKIFRVSKPKFLKDLFAASIKASHVGLLPLDMTQVCNHVRGISCISHKTKLAELISKYCKARQIDVLSVIPKTFLIRLTTFETDIERLASAKRKDDNFSQPVIVKPGEFANRGIGISMAYSLDETVQISLNLLRNKKNTNCVIVQYYIMNPLLYKGRKFDIRCYGLVVRLSGRTLFFWYEDGYARTSSFEYDADNKRNLMVHLTNEAVQVKGSSNSLRLLDLWAVGAWQQGLF